MIIRVIRVRLRVRYYDHYSGLPGQGRGSPPAGARPGVAESESGRRRGRPGAGVKLKTAGPLAGTASHQSSDLELEAAGQGLARARATGSDGGTDSTT